MRLSIHDRTLLQASLRERILRREIGERETSTRIPALYGDQHFVDNLDIVNELEGHSGCVNALSWSKSGRLLASGSDDRVVNIYAYQPDQISSQFNLVTTIDTGHSQNIFSVKFMPHSNDTKLVTCSGDSEVRVFDLERSALSGPSPTYLSATSAHAKVFKSHDAPVKRIVTESSPYYFLTCAEDGEVRQWDTRQPESHYPRNRPVFRSSGSTPRVEAPPPLITYAPYNIELYTISCSPRQPHYIALGGTHVHCFLHDRRMLGRNKLEERAGAIPRSYTTEASEAALTDATRCVAKFAPYGQPKMTKSDVSKNISGCKLGTAEPNELVVSWMGDYTYGFNILKDIKDYTPQKFTAEPSVAKQRAKNSTGTKKRKRVSEMGESPSNGPNFRSRPESVDEPTSSIGVIVRVGGIPITINSRNRPRDERKADPNSSTAHAQSIRKLKNSLKKAHFDHDPERRSEEMLDSLISSSKAFEKVDQYIATNPNTFTESPHYPDYKHKLRCDRAKVWRFSQASGSMARVLLGYRTRQDMDERAQEVDLDCFDMIRPTFREGLQPLDRHEQFGYDFIKAILLWLESGVGTLLREFSPESRFASMTSPSRLPVPRSAGVEALETHLIPYLESLATDLPITYAGHGGPGDDPRNTDDIFATEKDAVRALGSAMKLQFADLHGVASAVLTEEHAKSPDNISGSQNWERVQNRDAAITFWGHRVGMAVLDSASIDVNYPFVATAFGDQDDETERRDMPNRRRSRNIPAEPVAEAVAEAIHSDEEESDHDEGDSDNEALVHVDTSSEDDQESSDDSDDDDETPLMYQRRPTQRSKLAAARFVPTGSHIRRYVGHCNVATTKDVNFYGLNDEYVVSGSDCGNVFIWERKTSRLVNILQGDNEVVNVIQPHPYEPMLAVSGIDSTVKIFSPDSHARRQARHAHGISRVDPSTFTSIGRVGRRRRRATARNMQDRGTQHDDRTSEDLADREMEVSDSDSEYVYPNGLQSRRRMDDEYTITAENDMNRRSGNNQNRITRGVMELLAARLGTRIDQLENADENCCVM